MKFWRTLQNLRKTNRLSWLELAVLVFFFCALSFGQLGRLSWPVTFYPHDVLILVWLGLTSWGWLPQLVRTIRKLTWRRWWSGLAFMGWLILGVMISFAQTQDWQVVLYLGRLFIYNLFLFSLWARFKENTQLLRVFLVSTGMYMVWFGLVQYLLLPDTRYLYLFGWDDHYYRLIGPLLDPNLSGILFVITGWLLVAWRKLLPKGIVVSLLMMTILAAVLSYSRATYLSAIISLAVYWLFTIGQTKILKRAIISFAIFILALLALSLAPKPGGEGIDLLRTASITARLESSATYLANLKGYQWLTGAGLYSTLPGQATTTHARTPDNIIVLLVWSSGLVGLGLFFTLFTRLITVMKGWPAETLALLTAVLIHTQFNNTLLEPFVFLMLGIAILSGTHKLKT
ncbi:MAG: hypothetical protein COU66_00975 [Candidatus Pacebacteria bacterium CG10_big_fil_rev_8_21_14_0_10_44_11]|nr:MAG: hypothetical protein COU66_00975 [Candidatus Pacebacteria bacterium CG10_big_fil_rev_8_21_14_0_10_44_11]